MSERVSPSLPATGTSDCSSISGSLAVVATGMTGSTCATGAPSAPCAHGSAAAAVVVGAAAAGRGGAAVEAAGASVILSCGLVSFAVRWPTPIVAVIPAAVRFDGNIHSECGNKTACHTIV